MSTMIIDYDYPRVIIRKMITDDGTYNLFGQCNRCGECCKRLKCEHLIMETLDDEPFARCSIYNNRPLRCFMWPDLEDAIPDQCGFSWNK